MDFRKSFDNVPRDKLRERLKEIIVLPQLRIAMIHLYETITTRLKTNEGWSKDIKCNIGVKQGCPLFPSIFGIYIDKLEECLEIVGCKGTELVIVLFTLLLYVNDIVLLSRTYDDLDKLFKNLHDYFSKMGM